MKRRERRGGANKGNIGSLLTKPPQIFTKLIQGKGPADQSIIESRSTQATRIGACIAIIANTGQTLFVPLISTEGYPAVLLTLTISSIIYILCLNLSHHGKQKTSRIVFTAGLLASVTMLSLLFGKDSGMRQWFLAIAAGSIIIWPGSRTLAQAATIIASLLGFLLTGHFQSAFLPWTESSRALLQFTLSIFNFIILFLIVTAADQTSSALQERLRAKQEESDLLTRFSNHEIRNSITVLQGFLRRARKRLPPGSDESIQSLDQCQQETTRIANLLSEVLAIARMKRTGQQLEETGPIDIANTIQQSVDYMNSTSDHEITFHIAEEGHYIAEGDNKKLTQVIRSLIENAIKYSPRNQPISITCQFNSRTRIGIQVIDQGIGVPESEQALIFDQFFRSSNALQQDGSGLGLTFAKLVIDQMGGSLRLKSSQPGLTIFEIELPISSNAYLAQSI